MFTSIIATENNRVSKFHEFDTVELADAHCEKYGGLVYEGSYSPELYVEDGNITLVEVIKPVIVPSFVTMRQARLALLQEGMLGNVEQAIDTLPSPQKEAAWVEWEYSQEISRTQPLTLLMAQALELSDEQLDQLFIKASEL